MEPLAPEIWQAGNIPSHGGFKLKQSTKQIGDFPAMFDDTRGYELLMTPWDDTNFKHQLLRFLSTYSWVATELAILVLNLF